MKKFIYSIFIILIFLIFSVVIYLSTIGLETERFNNLIIQEIKKKDSKVELELKKIKIKIDLKKIQLFLSTSNPNIIYQKTKIPITEIKIYAKIKKLFYSKIEVTQTIFQIKKFKIKDMQKIAIRIKPSNFKTFLLNNLSNGEIEKASFDLNIDKNFTITKHKVNGTIKKIDAKIKKNFIIKDVSLNFIADNKLILINSINANYKGISVSNGSIDLLRKKNIEIKGKFNSHFNFKGNQISNLFTQVKFFEANKVEAQGSLIHDFNLKINNNYKIVDYDYKSNGYILQAELILKKIIKNNFLKKEIKKILFDKTKLEVRINKKKNLLLFNGVYSTDNSNYKKFKIKNNLNLKNKSFFIDFDLSEKIFLDIINFETNIKERSNIKTELIIKDNRFIFKSIDFTEAKNSISVRGLILNNKNEIENITSIDLQTFNKNKENNNLKINIGKKILISGKKYDSSNLLKLLSKKSESNLLKKFNKEIEIQIENLITKSQIPLRDFNLIGNVEKGKFNKIFAKSEFTKNKYLDISLKKDLNNKKIIEVYSDSPQALLADYKFFEGIKNGTLLYNSAIDKSSSVSKLTIENFKVTKAPAFATLLTLADLGGIADILSGQGMSFDILEINLEDDSKVTNITDLIALGKSVSLHMEGYIEKKTGLISLSGTLVPAKMLNNLVSRIPVVGNILVGDKVGEGVFGVSFKIKGLPGKTKTSVNPVKTITPRFITRALEKMKNN